MPKCVHLHLKILALLLLLLLPAGAQQTAPVTVRVSFHLLDFNGINTETETFSINGYLYLSWITAERPEEWKPKVHLVNAQAFDVFYTDKTSEGEESTLKIAFRAVLNSQFTFHRFPFDSNQLKIYVEPSDERGLVRLAMSEKGLTVDPLVFDAQWRLGGVEGRQVAAAEDAADGADRLMIGLEVNRVPRYHVWYYFLPLLLITASPWTVFWYRPPNPQVTVVCMLGLVAYNMVFAQHLPQLGYLSLSDAYFLTCLVGVFLTTICCALVLRLESAGQEERAIRFRGRCGWALPLLQGISIAGLLLWW